MDEPGVGTFGRILAEQITLGIINPDDAVLVQFGGRFDEQVCRSVGLRRVTFANISPGSTSTGETVAIKFDAHRMPQESGSFDHVIAHSGLHHCSRPHEALHEMYRLAKRTATFVENQDSVMMRLAGRMGFVPAFELPAVVGANYLSGGVDGRPVPNYVYRWTRRDLYKAVASFDPAFSIPVEIHSEWNLSLGRAASQRVRQKLHLRSDDQAERLLTVGQSVMNAVAQRQGNIFAATLRKDLAELRPWMSTPDVMVRQDG